MAVVAVVVLKPVAAARAVVRAAVAAPGKAMPAAGPARPAILQVRGAVTRRLTVAMVRGARATAENSAGR